MKEHEKKLVKNLVKGLDFVSIQTAMHALNWTYFDTKGTKISIRELKEMATKTCQDAIEHSKKTKEYFGYVARGGFRALFFKYQDGIYIDLSFEIEASNTDDLPEDLTIVKS